MSRKEKAVEYYRNGYNCAQAVICAYCDLWQADTDTVYRLSESYGGGMGQLGEVCGAVTGMFSAVGLKNSAGLKEPGTTKKSTYGMVKELAAEFKDKHNTIYCRDLLADESRPKQEICEGCVADACDIIEKYLLDKE